jgi:hypothetical protein
LLYTCRVDVEPARDDHVFFPVAGSQYDLEELVVRKLPHAAPGDALLQRELTLH